MSDRLTSSGSCGATPSWQQFHRSECNNSYGSTTRLRTIPTLGLDAYRLVDPEGGTAPAVSTSCVRSPLQPSSLGPLRDALLRHAVTILTQRVARYRHYVPGRLTREMTLSSRSHGPLLDRISTIAASMGFMSSTSGRSRVRQCVAHADRNALCGT